MQLPYDSVAIIHFPALGLRHGLQDRLWEHLRFAVTQLIDAHPQLLWIIVGSGIQREAERALLCDIGGHELQID